MCETKDEAKSKLDKLVQALDRHTDAIERLLVADVGQVSLEGDTRRFGGGPVASRAGAR